MKKIFSLMAIMFAAFAFVSCKGGKTDSAEKFVRVADGHFVRNGKPYYYVGTNFWYGAILGSEGRGSSSLSNFAMASRPTSTSVSKKRPTTIKAI